MSIFITLIALSVVIFIHELGHLLAAKWAKIGVYEFAIGMGPKIWGKQFGETLYSLRLLPIGGFVRLAGMDDTDNEAVKFPPERSLYAASPIARLVTISAGAIFNVILGFIVFVIVFSGFGVRYPITQIASVSPDSPAAAAGLLPGDTITRLNGTEISKGMAFIETLQKSKSEPIHVQVKRNDTTIDHEIMPKLSGNRYIIGVTFALSETPERLGPIAAVKWGLLSTWLNIKLVFINLKMMLTGAVRVSDMAGVVGIVQMASYGFRDNIGEFLRFMGMISIGLGVFNLLPLPALDGGHLFFLAIEVIGKRPISRKWEARISNAGFALLMLLMVFILINDVRHWKARTRILTTTNSR
ncbi:RIP metalloprotease RseP [bacterium]|nr:RIP metalloprotease RseP [bacterium]